MALAKLGAAGIVGYDLEAAAYFHRELPFDLTRLDALHPRLKEARKLLAEGGVGRVVEGHRVAEDGRLELGLRQLRGHRPSPSRRQRRRRSFGTRLVWRMVRDQLKGEMRIDWRTEGLKCEIAFPMDVQWPEKT